VQWLGAGFSGHSTWVAWESWTSSAWGCCCGYVLAMDAAHEPSAAVEQATDEVECSDINLLQSFHSLCGSEWFERLLLVRPVA
jgi:hypothetical protein